MTSALAFLTCARMNADKYSCVETPGPLSLLGSAMTITRFEQVICPRRKYGWDHATFLPFSRQSVRKAEEIVPTRVLNKAALIGLGRGAALGRLLAVNERCRCTWQHDE